MDKMNFVRILETEVHNNKSWPKKREFKVLEVCANFSPTVPAILSF